MAKTKRVVAIPPQPPRELRDGEPVLHIELPPEVVAPNEFADVDLIPEGDREIVPTGLAPVTEVLRTGFGLFSVVSALKRSHKPKVDGSGVRPAGTL